MLQPAAFRSKRHSTQKAKPLFNKRNGYTIVTKPPYKATLCKSILGYASFAERTVPNNHGHLCSHSLQRANAPKRSSHGYLEQFAFASLASLRGNRCCSRLHRASASSAHINHQIVAAQPSYQGKLA
jgi:hypothetical protein